MAVIITVLLAALAFFIYLLDESKNEVLRAHEENRRLREENKTQLLSQIPQLINPEPQTFSKNKRFVQVIFNKGSRKRYDYLLGDNDVKVDDFVLVPIHKSKDRLDKELQRMLIEIEIKGDSKKPRKTTCLRARVKYISKPGEVSKYARSEIIKKLNNKIW